MPGYCAFSDLWLNDDRYRLWLLRGPDKHKAKCRYCLKVFDIGNMGESALKSHMEGKKHIALLKNASVTTQLTSSNVLTKEKSDTVSAIRGG